MSRRAKSARIIEMVREILREDAPQTVRQCYYRLVSAGQVPNSRAGYKTVSRVLVGARTAGLISWDAIEDRLRQPRHVSMWSGVAELMRDAAAAYRRDVWSAQPRRVEVWLEKEALSRIFEEVLAPYGATLNVGRGYDGWSSIHQASRRLGDEDVVLYFGDFDPSGEDMVRSLRHRLAELGSEPEVVKCALTAEDIQRHRLPPNFAKRSDSRCAAFIEKHGDVSVELDAMPASALRERIVAEVKSRMDLDALASVRIQEEAEREDLRRIADDVERGAS
jgi:hypothetical protein